MLAAYMRLKYPNIIIGAIAASAPIYQVAGKLSGNIFFQGVTKVSPFFTNSNYENENANCNQQSPWLTNSWKKIAENDTANCNQQSSEQSPWLTN